MVLNGHNTKSSLSDYMGSGRDTAFTEKERREFNVRVNCGFNPVIRRPQEPEKATTIITNNNDDLDDEEEQQAATPEEVALEMENQPPVNYLTEEEKAIAYNYFFKCFLEASRIKEQQEKPKNRNPCFLLSSIAMPQKFHKCAYCNYVDNDLTRLFHHQNFAHLTEALYNCRRCNQKFESLEGLKYHVVGGHN